MGDTKSNKADSNSTGLVPNEWANFLRNRFDLLLAAGLLGLLPLMIVQINHLAARKHLQFFPIAWIFLVFIIYRRGQTIGKISFIRYVIGLGCLSIALLIDIFAVFKFSPWAGQVAVIVLLFGWMQIRLQGNRYTQFFVWIGVLALTLPLPMNLDSYLIGRLQTVSTASASLLMDLASVPHFTRGNVLEIRTGELFVDEACSGVDSLYALFSVALMLLAWQERSIIMSAATLALVPFWAWLGNVLRIFLISFLLDGYKIDLSHGFPHTILGLAIFACSFCFLLLTLSALDGLLSPFVVQNISTTMLHRAFSWAVSWPNRSPLSTKERNKKKEIPTLVANNPWESRFANLTAAIFLMFGMSSLLGMNGVGPWTSPDPFLHNWTSDDVKEMFSETALPEKLGEFTRTSFNLTHREYGNILGGHSATWVYVNNGRDVQISADFPFSGFHPLEVCYTNTGRQLLTPLAKHEIIEPDGRVVNVIEAQLSDDLEVSYLWYLNYDNNGVSVGPLESAILGGVFALPPVVYQVQIYVPECGTLTEHQKEEFRGLLLQASKCILPRIQQLQLMR